ncbi:flagellar biosynthetic protein FliO [Shouchella miscanthi]|uniref:Flagellar biosynthetic protein FliO n=1 Tax=Shouchella miscanthi TaxID=2598861 RepID=A0ABU6NHM8_9BACI|nr:flagellar biosynthetic protein FliO [Shouchella miscanthi]MED4127284.1 flagellar biosynthetic protein FliO [Shouchella miscanthi]
MPFLKQSVKGLLFVVVVLCFALVEHEHALAKDCSVQEAMESEACASSDAEVEETAVATESPWVSGLKMIGALLVVIFLLVTLLKFINKRSRSFQEAKGLSLLSGVSLGGNRSVQLVRVGEKLLVIGVSDQVQLLDTIDDPDEMEAILKKHQPEGEQGGLTQVLPWLKTADNQRQSSSTFQDILTSRLNLENQGLKKKVRMHDEGPKSL